MKVVKYRKTVAFGRLLIALGFVICALLLFLESMFSDASIPRRVFYFFPALIGFLFFGRMLILLIFVMFKKSTMFSYDSNRVLVNGVEIKRKDIIKVELDNNTSTGILGAKTPAFVIKSKGLENVNIFTYYVLTEKEESEIFQMLKQYASNHKIL